MCQFSHHPVVPVESLQEGRAVEAVADLSKAVEISDASPPALHYLAKAFMVIHLCCLLRINEPRSC